MIGSRRGLVLGLTLLGGCDIVDIRPWDPGECRGSAGCGQVADLQTPTRTDLFPTDDGRDEGFLTDVPVPGAIEAWADGDLDDWAGVDFATVTTTDTFDERCQELGHHVCFGFRYDEVRNSIVWEAPEAWAADPPTVSARYELLSAGAW